MNKKVKSKKGKKKGKGKQKQGTKDAKGKVKRMTYSEESVVMAVNEVKRGAKFSSTAEKYGIPASTLRAKVQNKYPDKKPGPSTVLTSQEEEDLVGWVIEMSKVGFPVTKHELLQSVKIICDKLDKKNPFTNSTPGRHWYESFMERHPNIAERVAENINLSKANLTEGSIRLWFTVIYAYLAKGLLLYIPPYRVFNSDETALPLNPETGKVLAQRGDKDVQTVTGNNEKENVTVLITANAAGQIAPPFILYKGKDLPENAELFAPDDYTFGYSDNGYMTADKFYEYMANEFEPWLEKQKIERPVVFYIDGHASHMTMELSKFCSEKQIILIALHPNATHLMQPLDVGFFRAFKMMWKKCHRNFCSQFSSIGIQKNQVAPVLKKTLDSMDSKILLENAFRKCGLHPFDVNAINFNKVLHRNDEANHLEPVNEDMEVDHHQPQSSVSLQSFESLIPQATLDQFRSTVGPTWMGAESEKSLYRIWYKLSHPSHDPVAESASEQAQGVELEAPQLILEIEPSLFHNSDLNISNITQVIDPPVDLSQDRVSTEENVLTPVIFEKDLLLNEAEDETVQTLSQSHTKVVVSDANPRKIAACDEPTPLNNVENNNSQKIITNSHISPSQSVPRTDGLEKSPMKDITSTANCKKQSSSVRKYLAYPRTEQTRKKRRNRSGISNPVISSQAWRQVKQERLDEKNGKELERLLKAKVKSEKQEEAKVRRRNITEKQLEREELRLEKEKEKLQKQAEKLAMIEKKKKDIESKVAKERETLQAEEELRQLQERQKELQETLNSSS